MGGRYYVINNLLLDVDFVVDQVKLLITGFVHGCSKFNA